VVYLNAVHVAEKKKKSRKKKKEKKGEKEFAITASLRATSAGRKKKKRATRKGRRGKSILKPTSFATPVFIGKERMPEKGEKKKRRGRGRILIGFSRLLKASPVWSRRGGRKVSEEKGKTALLYPLLKAGRNLERGKKKRGGGRGKPVIEVWFYHIELRVETVEKEGEERTRRGKGEGK